MSRSQVAPITIVEKAVVHNFAGGNLLDIYKNKEAGLPEFLRYSSVNCPPGFEFLLEAPGVIIQEVLHCCGLGASTFDILSTSGEKMVDGVPGSCFCGLQIKGMKDGQQLLNTERPFVLSNCCDKGMKVEAPKGNLLGYVTVQLDEVCCAGCECTCVCCACKCPAGCVCCVCVETITKPVFFIMDPIRQVMMTINIEVKLVCAPCAERCLDFCPIGCVPCAMCDNCCMDVVYILRANDTEPKYIGAGTVIGEIRRKYPGCGCMIGSVGCCRDPPRYEITFPEDMEIRMKVVVMSSVFLMRALYY